MNGAPQPPLYQLSESDKAKLKSAFALFDTDGNKCIDEEELKILLCNINLSPSE